jgi:hypothetical protein
MSTPHAAGGGLLAHNVFFSLHDASPAARERLAEACRRYLAPHAGVVFFAVGARAEELRRDVNDLDFDVGLHVVFADRAAHDAYQATAEHQRFIAEQRDNWKRVRVFDSLVAAAPAAAR